MFLCVLGINYYLRGSSQSRPTNSTPDYYAMQNETLGSPTCLLRHGKLEYVTPPFHLFNFISEVRTSAHLT